MGFLCKIREDKKNVSQEVVKETTFLRDIGLDSINNITTEINFCQEIFKNPKFTVTGATKLMSGLTETLTGCTFSPTSGVTGTTFIDGYYNLDVTSEITIDFFIESSSLDFTGYTGNFCYKVFPEQEFVPQITTGGLGSDTEILDKCIAFSAITSMTVSQIFQEGSLLKTWNQYLVRPYFTFISKECNPGLEFNSWNSAPQPNSFQDSTDFYFATVINPPYPILAPPPGEPIVNIVFYQDPLLIDGSTSNLTEEATVNGVLNYFILRGIPSSEVILFINGVRMTEGSDFSIINRGISIPPVLVVNGEVKITDWIVANYFIGTPSAYSNGDYSKWFINTLVVNTITTDTDPGFQNAVNVNTITGNYEIYTSQPIDELNAIFLTINGVEMVQNQQFFLSKTKNNRIIMDKTYVDPIKIGDIISIMAVSPKFIFGLDYDYGSLTTNEFTAEWSVPPVLPTNVTGKFKVQVVNKSDTNYNTILYQKNLDFSQEEANYTTTISNLALNQYYRFRVLYETTYTAYLDNKITTCSFSEGYFDTTSRYINNTY